MKNFVGLFFALVLISACSSTEVKKPANAEELYNQAFDMLESGEYTKSSKSFEELELEYPYSKWATKSKIMGAFAYFEAEEYDDAILSLDRFIKFHPGNKDIAYAYYLKSLCYYNQIESADKDQGNTRDRKSVV